MVVTPTLAFLVVAGLLPESASNAVIAVTTENATVADIVLEVVKVIGIIVSAVAACYCAKVAAENHRVAKRTEAKVDRRRERVRRADDAEGAKVVIEEGDRKRQDNV